MTGKPAAAEPPPGAALPEGILRVLRSVALAATGLLVAASTVVSFAESYRGLLTWAARHGVSGLWCYVWPLQVDVFPAVGELTLFAALVDRWPARARVMPWAVTLGGLAVSVAGNVGHVAGQSLAARGTAAVPPLAASASMAVGLAALKRVVRARRAPGAVLTVGRPAVSTSGAGRPAVSASPAGARSRSQNGAAGGTRKGPSAAELARHYERDLAAGRVPSQRAIRAKWRVGSDRARALREDLAAIAAAVPAGLAEGSV